MGGLRDVSRALLGDGRGPAEVIASLDRCATTFPAMVCTTVVYAVVDLTQHTITYSNRPPPPLLGAVAHEPRLARQGTRRMRTPWHLASGTG